MFICVVSVPLMCRRDVALKVGKIITYISNYDTQLSLCLL